jgi:alanyl aminopeptidase
VMPNEAGLSYYRMRPQGDLLPHLLASANKVLTLPERVTLVGDVNALVASGEVQKGVALDLVATLARDKSRHIVDASINVVASIDEMVPAKLRPNYQRFVRKLYQARAHELGWRAHPGEDDNIKQLRRSLLELVANVGGDAELIKQATELTWKWLDAHAAVDPEIVSGILAVASRHGDQKLFDRLHADARKAGDRVERERLLGAMGGFVDPKVVSQSLAIILSDEFELREATGILTGALREPRTRELAYQFVKDHFDEISNKLPQMYRPYLAFTFVALCDDARKAEIQAFFGPRIEKLDGGPRILAQALETLGLCAVQRKAQTPGVEAFLRRQ